MSAVKKRGKRAVSPFVRDPRSRANDDRRREFLRAVQDLTRERGGPPSSADIAERMGITRLGAWRMMVALEAAGLARDIPRKVRSGKWALTPEGEGSI